MRALILCLALLVALLASGCATVKGVPVAGSASPPAPSLPDPTTTTEPAPEPATNERGFIPAEIGDELCYGPIELDVPVVHGVLALQPGIVGLDGAGGWEWQF